MKIKFKVNNYIINILTVIAGAVFIGCCMVDDFNSLWAIPMWFGALLLSGSWLYLVGSAKGLFK